MILGLVGKPNVGKSTFYAAATKATAEIANYPFTTIEPNRGVAYLRYAPCPHVDLGTPCDPRTGACTDGTRWVPVEVLDVAGLVPEAHKGKGLGNKFLDDLRQADALVHVVDASGATSIEGNPVPAGSHDPLEDVVFLGEEITQWIAGIIAKGFDRAAKGAVHAGDKIEGVLADRLTGLGIDETQVKQALNAAKIAEKPANWGEDQYVELAREIRRVSKPILLAANKADVAASENLERLKKLENVVVVPTCAEAELALKRAHDAGVIEYLPGAGDFEIKQPGKLNAAQRKALDHIRENCLGKWGSTGVQEILERAVYDLLDRVPVFPVEDENHLTDKEGRILPDVHLLPKGSTAKDLAYKVHTDLGDHFIRAVNAKTHRVVGADYEVQTGDVIRIVAGK